MKLFNAEAPNRATRLIGGESSGILCWDDVRSDTYREIWLEMREQFWVSNEISMVHDAQHWVTKMTPVEKETYKLAIGQLAVLDSIATAFDLHFSQLVSDPAVKSCYAFVATMESIHNESYTYCLSSFTNRDEMLRVFEKPKEIYEMRNRNNAIISFMEDFIDHPLPGKAVLALAGNMILERIFFTSGFLYFYHLAKQGKMLGTQTMISLIQRDENIHGYLNAALIRDLLAENFNEVERHNLLMQVKTMFEHSVSLEKEWASVLYKDVPEIDIRDIWAYIEYLGNQCLDLLKMEKTFHTKENPLKWIQVYDPKAANRVKADFFEGKVTNYKKVDNEDFDDL